MIDLSEVAVDELLFTNARELRTGGKGREVRSNGLTFHGKQIIIPRRYWKLVSSCRGKGLNMTFINKNYHDEHEIFVNDLNNFYGLSILTYDVSMCYIHKIQPFIVITLHSLVSEEMSIDVARRYSSEERWYDSLQYRIYNIKDKVRKQFLYLSEFFPVEVLYVVLESYLPLI